MKITRLLISICCIVLFFNMTAFAEENQYEAEYLNEFITTQQVSNNKYNEMLFDFKVETHSEKVMPDYYAGAYIGDDGNLNINVNNDLEHTYNILLKYVVDKSKIHIVKYSYNELKSYYDSIVDYIKDNSNMIGKNIVATSIDEKENLITVELKDYSNQAISEFKREVCEFANISFNKGEEVSALSTTADLNLGERVYVGYYNGPQASIGIRCRRRNPNGSYETGFITCAHGHNGGRIYDGDIIVGTITQMQFKDTIDASFVAVSSQKSVGNGLGKVVFFKDGIKYDASTITWYPTTYALYTMLIMKGASTGSVIYGHITSVNASSYIYDNVNNKSVFLTDMFAVKRIELLHYDDSHSGVVKHLPVHGDSGGIVAACCSETTYAPLGIISGGDQNVTYCIKFANIATKFGLVTY